MVNPARQFLPFALTPVLLVVAALLKPVSGQEKYNFLALEQQVIGKDLSVSAAVNEQAALQADLNDTRLSKLPELSTYYRFFPDDLTFAENEFGATHFFGFRVSQDLVDLMKIRPGRIQAAKAALQVKDLQVGSEQGKALFDFRIAYVNTLAHRTKLHYYSELADITRQQLHIKEKQYDHHQELLPSVLAIEADLDNYEGEATYSEHRVASMQRAFAAYFVLDSSQFAWDDIDAITELPDLPVLLNYARENSKELQQFRQSRNIELGRAKARQYSDLHFTPFMGIRFRGDRLGTLGTDPEFGFRFSMPLTYFQKRNNRSRRGNAMIAALGQKAEKAEQALTERLSELYDRYRLAEVQVSRAEHQRYIYQEKLRIEKSKSGRSETLGSGKPETLLQLQSRTLEAELKSKLTSYDKLKLTYELLYTCGANDGGELRGPLEIPVSTAGTRNALWIWQSADIVAHRARRKDLLNFCRASNFDQVYLSINSDLAQQLDYDPRVASFLSKLHSEGVQISALLGDPNWIRQGRRGRLIDRVNKIVRYNQQAAGAEQFDALHIDIEPHLLPEWHNRKEALLQEYIATLDTLHQVLRAANSELPVELDVPVSFNDLAETQIKEIVNSADTIVIMAYNRLDPSALLSSVKNLVQTTQAFGKPLVIGLNSDDFHTQEELTRMIQEIRESDPGADSFNKFAIHDYADFKRLTEN